MFPVYTCSIILSFSRFVPAFESLLYNHEKYLIPRLYDQLLSSFTMSSSNKHRIIRVSCEFTEPQHRLLPLEWGRETPDELLNQTSPQFSYLTNDDLSEDEGHYRLPSLSPTSSTSSRPTSSSSNPSLASPRLRHVFATRLQNLSRIKGWESVVVEAGAHNTVSASLSTVKYRS